MTLDESRDIFYKLAVEKLSYAEIGNIYHLYRTTICRQMKAFKKFYNMDKKESYCIKTYLRFYHGDEIVNSYLNGDSSSKIAEKFNVSDWTIREVLKLLNVKIRENKIGKTDQSLFKEINDELTAYCLGLLTTDGSVYDNTVSITLTASDKYLLDEINERLLNNSGNIDIQNKANGQQTARLSFCGKEIVNTLKQYGIVPRKAETLVGMINLSDELMPHYIRGLYDGNGVCSRTKTGIRVGYCAFRIELTSDYQSFLCNKLFMRKNKLFNTGSCWNCSWSAKTDLMKFYDYIYTNSTISLSRKKQKLYNYLYVNTEIKE